jgi:2-haloacid dehalogenase
VPLPRTATNHAVSPAEVPTQRPPNYSKQVATRPDTGAELTTVVFDLGGVLIEWDPRRMYRTLFDDEAEMEHFLATICTSEWNLEQDRGRPVAEATELLTRQFPDRAELIEAYYGRWEEMLGDLIWDTVAIVDDLHSRGVRLLALTNWSHEEFPTARPRMTFLDHFDGVLVSGEVKLIKPDPAIFELLVERHQVDPATAVFVDDSPANVVSAAGLGFDAIRFTSSAELRRDLAVRGLL